MPKEKNLTINAPREGIAGSPHIGFGNMRNLDIYSIPGVTRLNRILEKKTSTTVDSRPLWIVKNQASPTNIYSIDGNGVVYNSSDKGATWSELSDRGGSGQGLAVWKDYLFVATSNSLDVYGPLSGSASWTTSWKSIDSDSSWHPILVSKLDGNLYIGSGRYISSIAEVSGQNFAPGTSATYSYTQQALDLPEDYRVKCLAEINNNLAIGTWVGSNIYDNKIADIFLWDGSSTTYNNPVQMTENGVNAMINIGGYLYVLAGTDGNIYKSNGVQAWKISELPRSVVEIGAGKQLLYWPGAIMHYDGRLYFGIGSGNNNIDGMGIYSLYETSKGNILNFEHTISTLNASNTNGVNVYSLLGISNQQFVAGWIDGDVGGSVYGIDLLNTASYAYSTDYSGYFESPLYPVGTYLNKKKFPSLQFMLAKELAASEGIQIKFRINLTDSWTTIGTYTTDNIGTGVTSFYTEEINIPECEQIQFRVELKGTATTTPEFKTLILS
jgi:hypothetical protein